MSESYTGEIRMFGGNYSPVHWAFCDGQELATSAQQELFSLLGSLYGGDGRSTFALPEMRGRVPLHYGQGPGLTNRFPGQRFGQEGVVLTKDQIPLHSHSFMTSSEPPASGSPSSSEVIGAGYAFSDKSSIAGKMNEGMIQYAGSGAAHYNMMPYSVVNFIICMIGLYPTRS
ncbi:phage tail protein [Vibrio quintilis]|uniref:Phage Tail Collar Domain protein n=1 Tax=Vibrio quintilis TaxID=1117707 RepID=A0A1M7YZ46_9VIBR|nr:tail fiber protein [Vibrio quintilis]SHO57843.1 Phage Tail Collar Domain protein [Vibrio quintilis]